MSKEISDVMGRLRGNLLALEGMEPKISPPPPPPPPTTEQAAQGVPPPPKPKKEDYDYVKKLAEEIQGLCKNLMDYIDSENKVPPPPESTSPQPEAAPKETGHKTKG